MKTPDEAMREAAAALVAAIEAAPHMYSGYQNALDEEGEPIWGEPGEEPPKDPRRYYVDGEFDPAAVIAAVIRALDAAGWVCVPKEATEEMVNSATPRDFIGSPEANQGSIDRYFAGHRLAARNKWHAMLAAAPRLTGAGDE